jgi:hypothetical protein
MPELLHNLLLADMPEAAIKRAVYVDGRVILENKVLIVDKVLLACIVHLPKIHREA